MSIRPPIPHRTRPQGLLQRHPVLIFFALTYALSWVLWAPLVVFRDELPGALVFLLLVLGSLVPSTMGILFVAVLRGKAGVRGPARPPAHVARRTAVVPGCPRRAAPRPVRSRRGRPVRRLVSRIPGWRSPACW